MKNKLEPIDYDIISPGVRDLVRELREVHGLDTVDSGDGSNYKEGMECALPFRHVFIKLKPEEIIHWGKYLQTVYPSYRIETSWAVGEDAFLMIFPDGISES